MFRSPTRMLLTEGVGVHGYALTAFEFALRDADIEQQNLACVSSILPPRCQVIGREGLQANWDFLSDFQQRGGVCAPRRRCIFQTKAGRRPFLRAEPGDANILLDRPVWEWWADLRRSILQ